MKKFHLHHPFQHSVQHSIKTTKLNSSKCANVKKISFLFVDFWLIHNFTLKLFVLCCMYHTHANNSSLSPSLLNQFVSHKKHSFYIQMATFFMNHTSMRCMNKWNVHIFRPLCRCLHPFRHSFHSLFIYVIWMLQVTLFAITTILWMDVTVV